jgi:hypothetical protein
MRIYIIGNDGIRLSREAPAVLNEGEIAVASNEELHAAPLSGKRLLALWNALPGEKGRPTRGVGEQAALLLEMPHQRRPVGLPGPSHRFWQRNRGNGDKRVPLRDVRRRSRLCGRRRCAV